MNNKPQKLFGTDGVRGVANLEPITSEIALRLGYITLDHFEKLAERCGKSSYGQYLMSIHRSFAKSRRAEL